MTKPVRIPVHMELSAWADTVKNNHKQGMTCNFDKGWEGKGQQYKMGNGLL